MDFVYLIVMAGCLLAVLALVAGCALLERKK